MAISHVIILPTRFCNLEVQNQTTKFTFPLWRLNPMTLPYWCQKLNITTRVTHRITEAWIEDAILPISNFNNHLVFFLSQITKMLNKRRKLLQKSLNFYKKTSHFPVLDTESSDKRRSGIQPAMLVIINHQC